MPTKKVDNLKKDLNVWWKNNDQDIIRMWVKLFLIYIKVDNGNIYLLQVEELKKMILR